MPVVFVHGVATRPSDLYTAQVAQRDALLRSIVFKGSSVHIENPDWGSFGVSFNPALSWLPTPGADQAFAAGGTLVAAGTESVDLGALAARDGAQAIDLVIMGALDEAAHQAALIGVPAAAGKGDAIALATAVGDYLDKQDAFTSEEPAGIAALRTATNIDFADALAKELSNGATVQAFGVGALLSGGLDRLKRIAGNHISDAILKERRRELSRHVAYFLGDIFVYLKGRDDAGADGTRARIFRPIIDALASAAAAPRADGEPLVVIGHSLGGVILYDILTDPTARAAIEQASGRAIAIDALFTVGSQPGFFADLGLYAGGRLPLGAKRPQPAGVAAWQNIFDYTDVFSFRCGPMFEGVRDFGYDTVTDLLHAHSAYFLRPSFYARIRARLVEMGHA